MRFAYLASPYSHPDEEVRQQRHDEVARIALKLLDQYVVFCPIVHSHALAQLSELSTGWEFWKKQDLGILDRCDILIVAMMDGWDKSVGVNAEIVYAQEVGMKIMYLDPEYLTNDAAGG